MSDEPRKADMFEVTLYLRTEHAHANGIEASRAWLERNGITAIKHFGDEAAAVAYACRVSNGPYYDAWVLPCNDRGHGIGEAEVFSRGQPAREVRN